MTTTGHETRAKHCLAAASCISARAARAGLVAIAAAAVLAGCDTHPTADLEAKVSQMLTRPGRPPEDLPPIQAYVAYSYQSSDVPDPFKPFYQTAREQAEQAAELEDNGISPDLDRNKEDLEFHPLDSLRMMGTLDNGKEEWGIVRSPDAVIHRVQVGNYMGQNHGRINSLNEEAISLTEIVPDGQGRWIEREASVALSEQ